MDNKNSNIDNDFVDIAKENNNTIYIIVGILYFIVIILSIFLIIGVKNQKDVVEDNIKENTNNKVNIEDIGNSSDDSISKDENLKNQDDDIKSENDNNLFEDISSDVDKYNEKQNEKINDGMSLLESIE